MVLKVNKPGLSHQQLQEFCQQSTAEVKRALNKYFKPQYYHSEIFMVDHITEEEMGQLHATCDCFVNTSFGEAWSIPTFDAMGYGNLVISSNTGGMKDYLTQGILVDGEYVPCFGADPAFLDLHTAHERWFEISIPRLQSAMRKAFTFKEELLAGGVTDAQLGKKKAIEYSHLKVGLKMKEFLNVE